MGFERVKRRGNRRHGIAARWKMLSQMIGKGERWRNTNESMATRLSCNNKYQRAYGMTYVYRICHRIVHLPRAQLPICILLSCIPFSPRFLLVHGMRRLTREERRCDMFVVRCGIDRHMVNVLFGIRVSCLSRLPWYFSGCGVFVRFRVLSLLLC